MPASGAFEDAAMTHYEVLGVPPGITAEELRAAFIWLTREHHPDRFAHVYSAEAMRRATERFAQITAAYAVVCDPKRRAQYDAQLKMLGNQCPACGGTGRKQRSKGFTAAVQTECAKCSGTGQAKTEGNK